MTRWRSLAPKFANVSFVALCGTYDEVLTHFKKSTRRKTVLWLGSSIGNFACDGAVQFIAGISDSTLTANDSTIIIGMDKQKAPEIIMDAYHDSQGITAEFELNALTHANRLFSDYAGEGAARRLVFLTRPSTVTWVEALEDTLVKWPSETATQVKELCGDSGDLPLQRGERIYIESSHKYGDGSASVLARSARFIHTAEWQDSRNYYMLNIWGPGISSRLSRRHSRLLVADSHAESWIKYVGGSDLVFGLAGDDEFAMQGQVLRPGHVFGWDNESPQTRISLGSRSLCTRATLPISSIPSPTKIPLTT
ncbi:hypothetical protein IWW39_001497 [Coemansia spiralis]|uniref:PLD phosphodiesterase domain-containing protein n=1 Tax=Coemansia spiralis TaxID=417178 RepID=A0A9W8GHR7_9FUNG|nr:hypothetical protein IWW39_001497 [Coemansia spiralis]